MKNIIVTTFTVLVIGMFWTSHPAFAGDRVKVYEMAESGTTIEFKMTPKEIAAEDAKKLELTVLKEAKNNKPQNRVREFEMGESGQIVTFSMTVVEIAAEDTENARLATVRNAKSKKLKKHVITYELAESSISVEFPVKTSDKVVTEAITEKIISEDLKI